MEKTIETLRLPNTDSIEELVRFWDTHDLTDFEEDLEEVTRPVFVRAGGTSLSVDLAPAEARHLTEIARSKGVQESTVLRQWILERLQESSPTGRGSAKGLQPARTRARR